MSETELKIKKIEVKMERPSIFGRKQDIFRKKLQKSETFEVSEHFN